MTTSRAKASSVAVVVAAALALGLSSCSRTERWCELDEGDVLVANSYCESGTPGYEWEPDHDKPKAKKKPKKTTTTAPKTTTKTVKR